MMTLLSVILTIVGLLGPGWLFSRALGIQSGLVGAFVGSAAVLFMTIMILDALGMNVSGANIGLGLAGFCLLTLVVTKHRKSFNARPLIKQPLFKSDRDYIFGFLAVIGFTSVVFNAVAHPLAGYDTYFRWNFLAEQLVRLQTLKFYPAVTDRDFTQYGWCDGIAPLVADLYTWAYIVVGRTAVWATAPVILLQSAALFASVFEFTRLQSGSSAAFASVALLASSPLLLWGISLGQETALTALSPVAMFLFLRRSCNEPQLGWSILAGVAAGLGGLAREYGLCFILLGVSALIVWRATRAGKTAFITAAAVVALPWYARNWWRTGNPLWPHDIAHLFPVNEVHEDYMRVVAETLGLGTPSAAIGAVSQTAFVLALLPLVLGFRELWRPGYRMCLVTAASVVLLWIWSIGQTSAGYVYSLRVLTPVIALCAVAGGSAVNRLSRVSQRVVGAIVAIAVIDACGRSIFLPIMPVGPWWRIPREVWLQRRDASVAWDHDPTWRTLANVAGSQRIVVSDPYTHTALAKLGATPVPLFSPAIRFLFGPNMRFSDCVARLNQLNIRFILLPSDRGITAKQLARYPFFKNLASNSPTVATSSAVVYDLMLQANPHSPSVHGDP